MSRRVVIVALVLLGLLAGLRAWLFRERWIDGWAGAQARLTWAWGRQDKLYLHYHGRDSHPDIVFSCDPDFGCGSDLDPYQTWYNTDDDGFYEVFVQWRGGDRDVPVMWRDSDGDNLERESMVVGQHVAELVRDEVWPLAVGNPGRALAGQEGLLGEGRE